jgi:hypothetical protein
MKRISLIAVALFGLALVLGGCDKKADLSTVPINPAKDDVKPDEKARMSMPPLGEGADKKK